MRIVQIMIKACQLLSISAMSCSLKIQGDTSLIWSWGRVISEIGGFTTENLFFLKKMTHYISKDAKFDAAHSL